MPVWFKPFQRLLPLALLCLTCFVVTSCASNMRVQPRYNPLAPSQFFTNGMSARPLVAGTISQEETIGNLPYTTGKGPDGQLVASSPISITLPVLQRGQQEYDAFCSPCHGLDGYGQGMIVQRGFSAPPSFHSDRLRQAPDGHYFDVITNGFGQMYSYGYRVNPADRWAIVAYIRALQLSQNAPQQIVPPAELQKIQSPQ
jgi:mono/diheme cytochrome c family protein